MKLVSLALTLLLTSQVFAEVNFDEGVSTDKVIKDSTYMPLPQVKYGIPGQRRVTRDCARFSFGPSDSDIMSDRVWLRSDEYITECYTTYVPGPNGQQIPQQHCYERLGYTYRSQAQINIKQRKLFPWEKETFEVCLEGQWLDIYTIEAGYKYKVSKTGYNDALFVLSPEYKIPTKPDPEGINYTEFSYDKETKKYTFKLNDKWANEYAGEKVYIKIELKKDKANWFDPSLGIKEYTFDVANNYTIEFSEDELIKPETDTNDNTYRSEKLFETRGYYLEWGFKRLGKISKDSYMDKGKTSTIQK
ncbi:MAG: hypothetical protein K6357_00195 [Elusimicrobiota bacterium]